MTTIPTVEKTEKTKCHTCTSDCTQLCIKCERSFCTKHLLEHSEKCNRFKAIIHSILRDDLTEILKQIMEVMLRTI